MEDKITTSVLNLNDGDVLVVSLPADVTSGVVEQIRDNLCKALEEVRLYRPDVHVNAVLMPSGYRIDEIPEETMNRIGYYRKRERHKLGDLAPSGQPHGGGWKILNGEVSLEYAESPTIDPLITITGEVFCCRKVSPAYIIYRVRLEVLPDRIRLLHLFGGLKWNTRGPREQTRFTNEKEVLGLVQGMFQQFSGMA